MTEKKPPAQPIPRRERRSRTTEEDAKALAWRLLKENIETDPLLKDRYIAQMTGFDIAKARREAMEENYRLQFLEQGFIELRKNPEWGKEIARDAIYEAMGKKPPEPKPEEGPYRPTIDDILENYEMVEDFLKRNGCKQPAIWEQIASAVFNPEVLKGLENLIRTARGQGVPPPPGANYSPPPHNATEEQTTASGFDDFAREPSPTPPPPGPMPNPFTWPTTGHKGKCPWDFGQYTPTGSSQAAKEQPQSDTSNDYISSAQDINPKPSAQIETDQPVAGRCLNSEPKIEPPTETNPNQDQPSPQVSEANSVNLETGAESLQDEGTSPFNSNGESKPTLSGEIQTFKINAKEANAIKKRANRTTLEPLVLQADQSELHDKLEPKTEVESHPDVTSSQPHAKRLKREKPMFDLDPDPVNIEDDDLVCSTGPTPLFEAVDATSGRG